MTRSFRALETCPGEIDGAGLVFTSWGICSCVVGVPQVSQEVLAEMVGTTRSRVNLFMNKFRKLGFIDYNGALKINNSLLSVVLRD